MSFFDDASLIYIADFAAASASAVSGSGTNTGKAYSIKPTDGSGDFDFERGSDITATRVNSSGYIEKGRGNFLLQSNQFDTTWFTVNLTPTSGQIGYDGSSNAWLLQIDATSTSARIEQTISSTKLSTYSVYAKAGTTSFLALRSNSSATVSWFDLSGSGSVTKGSNAIDAVITSVGNGWFRCSIVFDSCTSVRFYVGDAASYPVTEGANIYIQDAQLEQGLVATDYIETTTSPLRAGLLEDEPRFDYHNSASTSPNTCPSLLMEPSRTNLITNSEYIDASTDWTIPLANVIIEKNSITSPENQTNATKLTGNGGSAQRRIYQSFSQVSGSDFTTSIFAKEDTENILFLRLYNTTDNVYANASFNLSTGVIASNASGTAEIENYGNGWYRCILTGTPSTTTTTGGAYFNLTSDGNSTSTTSLYLWGAQIEQASYATSYIPTYGTAATRGGDSSTSSTISNVTEGVLFFEGSVLKNNNTIKMIEFNDNTLNNVIQLYYRDSSGTQPRVYAIAKSGGSQVYGYAYDIPSGKGEIIHKVAFRFADNDFALFYNGTKVHSQTSGTISTNPKSQIDFSTSLGALPFFGNAKQILVFPEALSDDDCATLTTP